MSMDIGPEEHVAVIGESGCGKSVLGHSMMRLLDDISETEGEIWFEGRDLRALDRKDLDGIRGARIALIPQSPSTSLDPVMKIGRQIEEIYTIHGVDRAEARRRTAESLRDIGFADPEAICSSYPHRMSGGMCERAVISMGVSLNPALLIADEPTKGLDPGVKINVLRQLLERSRGRALMMITHDYNAIRICERTVVMYNGRIVEDGPTPEVIERPMHPYTKALWGSVPSNGMRPIPGSVEKADSGCDYSNRCSGFCDRCREAQGLKETSEGHFARCWDARAPQHHDSLPPGDPEEDLQARAGRRVAGSGQGGSPWHHRGQRLRQDHHSEDSRPAREP
ncbi:MAG: ABC transporter ATP-binding protein [Candidatus Methanomethylophilaceae archaeon]|nr:ABC transporter ATP-binding protein [Candidatus Methanomethylophilaceae archaeon]